LANIQKLTPVKKKTITEMVAEQLVQFVLQCEAGDRLPSERELMGDLGVGRSSLREALRALEIMGLVETRTGEGTFVSGDSNSFFQRPLEWGIFNGSRSLADLLEARKVFETSIVELASQRITDEQLNELEEVMQEMEAFRPPDFEGFLTADLRFHDIIARSTGNGVLCETVKLTRRIIREERTRSFSTTRQYRESCRYHRKILDALKERHTEAARKAMAAHMAYMEHMFSK
jgi:GntR family transcriptional repressor for pyruvate dehydrogenase complex